jgi:ubiquinone/menaquinone biosynthesis C-methylase UbiE
VGDFRDPAVATSWHGSQLSHPARGRQLDLLVELVADRAPRRLIDLGVGSGLVAERVLDMTPSLEFVGIDVSPVMLAQARKRLTRFGGRVTLIQGDVADPTAFALSQHDFDIAVTVQTLHNVPFTDQQAALRFAAGALRPGGTLLSLDKTAVPAGAYDLYSSLGVSSSLGAFLETFAEYETREAAAGEHAPPLGTFLSWLESCGFDAGVLEAHANYALVGERTRT